MKMTKYEPLQTRCDLSGQSLGWAAQTIGPSFFYDLYIHENSMFWVRTMLRQLNADTRENPLAPYINLRPDNECGPYEWYLSANGKCVGSQGC